jgi:NADH:ubiquinone reductase (H+-translocating)
MGHAKPRIVIASGGFAGLYAAIHFDKTLARTGEAEVVLICRENFILFAPVLHEVAAGDLHPADIVNPLRRILRHVNVVQAEIDSVDVQARTVSCVGGIRDVRREFEYECSG